MEQSHKGLDIGQVRAQIPALKSRIYLDNAGTGPPTKLVLKEMERFLREWSTGGEVWEKWLLEVVKARELFGKLLGAKRDEVACVPNVTLGLVAIACSMNYKANANVVVSGNNFPTNVYVWHSQRKKGILKEVRLLKPRNGIVPLDEYERAIDDRTALVSVDYVSWLNGCRENIKEVAEIAHEHGALMVVDGFHALGVMPVDVRKEGIDAFASGVYKWLMGPHGCAFLYVKNELLDELHPSFTGWHGIRGNVIERVMEGKDPFVEPFGLEDAIPSDTASRFEWGTWSTISVIGGKAALEQALNDDMNRRHVRVLSLTSRLTEGLARRGRKIVSPLEKERRSGILSFEDSNQSETVARLKKKRIIVAGRLNSIRASPHFYNTEEEIDELLEGLTSSEN